MFNKKIIIIIILAVIIFFASAALVFFLVKRAGNGAMENSPDSNIIEELKNNNPGLSNAQLKFYVDTAAGGSMAPCLGRGDAGACVASVSFIKGDRNLCHDLEYKDEKLYQDCAEGVLKKKAKDGFGQCAPFAGGDDYYNCLWAILDVYGQKSDCADIANSGAREICEDFFNYQTAYSSYDRELCKNVKTEKLNEYCLKNIIDKNQDTDGDGLTDLDEINKYKTHYLFADSDNDGIKDGAAVKRGLIKAK